MISLCSLLPQRIRVGRVLLATTLLLAIATSASAALHLIGTLPASGCMQQLLTAYHKLAGMENGKSGVYHLQFTTKTFYQVPGKNATRETAVQGEIFSQGRKGFFTTKDIAIWQDGQYIATVLHAQHTVFLTRAVPGQSATDPTQIFMLRDSLLKSGTLQQCKMEQVDKQAYQHIKLGYSGSLSSRLKVRSLDFWLTPGSTLQRMSIQYLPGAAVQKMVLLFSLQEWLNTSSKLPVDARAQVVDPQGKLLPAYRSYSLINQIKPVR